jgi:heptosyltransferase-2
MLRPDPPSSLGNLPPPVAAVLDLPALPPERAGKVVEAAPGSAGVDLAACRRILVVKLDFIGDFVLTTPFLAGLRMAAPRAEVTLVVLDRVYAIASRSGLVDRVVAVPAAAEGSIRLGAASAEGLAGFVADIEAGAFDLALVPRWDTDFNGATRIAGLSRAAKVVGFSERCTPRKAVDNPGLDRFLDVAILDQRACHEVEHLFAMLDALGAPRVRRLQLDLTDVDRDAAADFRRSRFGAPGPSSRPLLAVAPFAAGRRQWPLERMADLVGSIAGRFVMDVAVIGGAENAGDASILADRLAAAGLSAAATAGILDLSANAALIAGASLFIGMDSGPGHMAAALAVPVVTISGHAEGASPGHPAAPERFGPWGDAAQVLVLRPRSHRHPCRDGCDRDEPHCILAVEVADALAAVSDFAERVLAARAAG